MGILGCQDSLWGSVVFVCCALIVIGMFELANEMCMPFGSGDVDFPVEMWFMRCWNDVAFLFSSVGTSGKCSFLKDIVKHERMPIPHYFDSSSSSRSEGSEAGSARNVCKAYRDERGSPRRRLQTNGAHDSHHGTSPDCTPRILTDRAGEHDDDDDDGDE